MKLAIFCFVIYAEILCAFAAGTSSYRGGEACLVQYLQKQGKLDINFKPPEEPSPNCFLITPVTKLILKKTFTDRIKNKFPSHSDCLVKKFDSQETLDMLIKISVIRDSDEQDELKLTRSSLHEDLKSIMSNCEMNDNSFLTIFKDYLGIKNETLEVLQQDYCMTKYVADNKILDLKNVELNPKQIDIENLDCDRIVGKLRQASEDEVNVKFTPNGQKVLKCVMDAHKHNGIFEYGVALKVINNLDVPMEFKRANKDRLTPRAFQFNSSAFNCMSMT